MNGHDQPASQDAASPSDPARAALAGALIADALAMPVHWYYDQAALDRDYGPITGYAAPRNPHPDSILWRSHWDAPSPQTDILGPRREHWGRRGVHYHQFLQAGDNTLNFLLALELFDLVLRDRDYDPERWLERYVAFMLAPASHADTYVEEYHRHFFTNLAAGRKPINCGVRDVHIGGLVPVPALVAALGPRHPDLRRVVRVHVGLTHKDADVLAAADAFVRMLADACPRPDEPPAAPQDRARTLREAILEHGGDWISAAKLRAWEEMPDTRLVGGVLSSACYIDDAFPAALALAWRHAGDVAGGVIANARCGGDNCHRGAVVGALLAASAPIPAPLLAGLRLRGRVAAD